MLLIDLLITSLIILFSIVLIAYCTHWFELFGKILQYKLDQKTEADLGTEGHYNPNVQK